MRKSKLIELLSSLKGNPEINLWNGFVQDYTDITHELIPVTLVRMTKEHWLENCRIQACRKHLDWGFQLTLEKVQELTKRYNKIHKWVDNPFVTQEDIDEGRYNSKVVYVMQAKNKGIETFDRAGGISY